MFYFVSTQILTVTTITNISANTVLQQNETSRLAKSMWERVMYPKTKTQNTINHQTAELHNSFGVSGNVGIGFHFGGGYRVKNGDGHNEQEIVHNKMYDKYMGTSFGFGSLGKIKSGHKKDIEQSISEDQQLNYNDESILADQEPDNGLITTTTTTEKPKAGVFRKISSYWAGEQLEPKSDHTSNGVFKWSMQKFINKKSVGTPR